MIRGGFIDKLLLYFMMIRSEDSKTNTKNTQTKKKDKKRKQKKKKLYHNITNKSSA